MVYDKIFFNNQNVFFELILLLSFCYHLLPFFDFGKNLAKKSYALKIKSALSELDHYALNEKTRFFCKKCFAKMKNGHVQKSISEKSFRKFFHFFYFQKTVKRIVTIYGHVSYIHYFVTIKVSKHKKGWLKRTR